MRLRKIISRSNTRVTGKFATLKMRGHGKPIYWESQIERNAARILDIDPHIISYSEQSVALRYRCNGEVHEYTPDFVARRCGADGPRVLILEVKPDKEANSLANRQLFDLYEREFEKHGYRYEVWRQSEIEKQPRLRNAALLLRYRRVAVSDVIKERVRLLLARSGPLPIAWFNEHPDVGIRLPEISALVLTKYLALDIHSPISEETKVWNFENP